MTTESLPIVVAYDGSDEAQLALAWSAETARLDGSSLRVVVVGPEPNHGSGRARDGDEHPMLPGQLGQDPAQMPVLKAYLEGPFQQIMPLFRENMELKKAQQA